MSCRVVVINGRERPTEAATLADLLAEEGLDTAAAIACAINRGFVPRTQWATRVLAEGDRIVVIAHVTGG